MSNLNSNCVSIGIKNCRLAKADQVVHKQKEKERSTLDQVLINLDQAQLTRIFFSVLRLTSYKGPVIIYDWGRVEEIDILRKNFQGPLGLQTKHFTALSTLHDNLSMPTLGEYNWHNSIGTNFQITVEPH